MNYEEIQRETIIATSSLINTVSVHVSDCTDQPSDEKVISEINDLIDDLLHIKEKIILQKDEL